MNTWTIDVTPLFNSCYIEWLHNVHFDKNMFGNIDLKIKKNNKIKKKNIYVCSYKSKQHAPWPMNSFCLRVGTNMFNKSSYWDFFLIHLLTMPYLEYAAKSVIMKTLKLANREKKVYQAMDNSVPYQNVFIFLWQSNFPDFYPVQLLARNLSLACIQIWYHSEHNKIFTTKR